MNWLLLFVIGIMVLCAMRGYRKGFLRILYSLCAIVVTIVFVTAATPYIANFIEKHTNVRQTIEEKSLAYIHSAAEKDLQESAEEKKERLNDSGIRVPEGIWEELVDSGVDVTGDFLEQAGFYEMLAENMAHFIVNGIAYFTALLVISIALFFAARMVNLVAKLPLVRNVNHFFGVVAGLVQGIILVWVFFYLITICCTSSFGMTMMHDIHQSKFLLWLYDNNVVLYLAMTYF